MDVLKTFLVLLLGLLSPLFFSFAFFYLAVQRTMRMCHFMQKKRNSNNCYEEEKET